MNGFTFLFLIFVLSTSAILLWLAQRQRMSAIRHREQVPEAFRDRISLAVHQKAADYTVAKMRLEQIDTLVGAILVLVWTLGGGLNALAHLWANSGWGEVAAGTGLMVSAILIMALIDMPLDVYRTFIVEAKFGFNRTSLGLYLADAVKQGVLLALLGTPLIALLLWLVTHAGAAWWLYGWATWMLFTSAMMWLYPTVIAPLFNRFTPLEDEALRDRIVRLLQRCGFASGGIFVMDGSKRSQHGNAYFTGFGASKRIVLFDTLLARLAPPEVEAVLAHELGHYRRHHVWKRVLLLFAFSFALLWILGRLIDQQWFYAGLDVSTQSAATGLLLFVLVMPVFTFLLHPLTSLYSRRHEYEADAYAASHASAAELVKALVKLYQDNAATLTPDPLHSAFYDSHPPAATRIARLQHSGS
jgi:STE24 endopeptidase